MIPTLEVQILRTTHRPIIQREIDSGKDKPPGHHLRDARTANLDHMDWWEKDKGGCMYLAWFQPVEQWLPWPVWASGASDSWKSGCTSGRLATKLQRVSRSSEARSTGLGNPVVAQDFENHRRMRGSASGHRTSPAESCSYRVTESLFVWTYTSKPPPAKLDSSSSPVSIKEKTTCVA